MFYFQDIDILSFLLCTLFIVSSRGNPASRCEDPDNRDVMNCCNGHFASFVEDTSIDVNYTVIKYEKDEPIPWGLEAHVTWEPPIGNDTSFEYAVSLAHTVTPQRAMEENFSPNEGECHKILYQHFPPKSCFLPEDETWTITNETFMTMKNLTFGYQYRFQIRVFDGGVASAFLTCKSDALFFTPDCYVSTNDEEFCRNYVTSVLSSAPVNLTVSSATKDGSFGGEERWTLILEWTAPLSANGRITAYLIQFQKGKADVSFKRVNESLPPDYLFQHNASGVIRTEEIFEIEVSPWVFIEMKNSVGSLMGPSSKITVNPDDLLDEEIQQTDAVATTTTTTTTPNSIIPTTDRASTTARGKGESTNSWFIVAVSSVVAVTAVVVTVITMVLVCRGCGSKTPPPTAESFHPFHRSYSLDEVTKRKNFVEDVFKDREIFDYNHIQRGEILGNGAFGVVRKGKAMLRGATTWTDVAIKEPKAASPSDGIIEDFKNEIRLMIELGKHKHIVSVLGCCTVGEPYYLITEYMQYGDLLHFLQKCYDETNAKLDPIYKLEILNQLQIARQIADGMNYVSTTRFFHGDLAARNILVGRNLSIKITDFGLTDDLYQSGYTRFGDKRRPLKWYSPESIENKYCTLKTDIWSFGVVLWEIFTFGRQTPYHGMSINEVVHRLVKTGYRLQKPSRCPPNLYVVMLACWNLNPAKRPPFADILETLNFIINKIGDHTNYVLTDTEDNVASGGKPSKLSHADSLLSIISSQSESGYASMSGSSEPDISTSTEGSTSDLSTLSSFVTNSDLVVTGDDAVTMTPILEEDENV